MTRWLSAAAVAAMLVTTGCGADEKAAAPTQTAKTETESEGAKTACKAPATTKATGLPAAFPIPGELTITQVRKDGPTNVVDGYWASGIDEAYREYKDQVKQAGYTILFDEKEKNDAEISYKSKHRTGQIALRGDCSEAETTRVHITNRPQ